MTDMPTADVATADMPTADAQNSGHSRHRGTATTTNAHGGAAEPQRPHASTRNESNIRSEAQTTTTKQIDTPRGNLSSCEVIRQYEAPNEP